jgi:hypothetical protein
LSPRGRECDDLIKARAAGDEGVHLRRAGEQKAKTFRTKKEAAAFLAATETGMVGAPTSTRTPVGFASLILRDRQVGGRS